MAANANATPAKSETFGHFCDKYLHVGGDLATVAELFLVAALLLGFAYGVVELIKKHQAPAAQRNVAPGTLKDLIDSLKALLEALASAPAWLALFGLGMLLFWGVGAAVPEACQNSLNDVSSVTDHTGHR